MYSVFLAMLATSAMMSPSALTPATSANTAARYQALLPRSDDGGNARSQAVTAEPGMNREVDAPQEQDPRWTPLPCTRVGNRMVC
jgi:hypothetical protein